MQSAIPKRKNPNTRSITINYLQDDKNDDKWYHGRKPGRLQQRRMISLAVTIGIYQVMSQHTYKVGDVCHLQMEGGAIGLELTGAVSRAFMMSWDKKYLEMVRKAGIKMRLYKRYIDDSNQVADVPQPGSRYDKNSGKVVHNENELTAAGQNENDDAMLARILKDIANQVTVGIEMEEE